MTTDSVRAARGPATDRETFFHLLRARARRPLSAESLRADLSIAGDGLGLDSIAIAELVLELEAQFAVSLVDAVTGDHITVGDLASRLGIDL